MTGSRKRVASTLGGPVTASPGSQLSDSPECELGHRRPSARNGAKDRGGKGAVEINERHLRALMSRRLTSGG